MTARQHGGDVLQRAIGIGGLALATVITLVLVPVIDATFTLDLELVRWQTAPPRASATAQGAGDRQPRGGPPANYRR